MHAAMRMRRVAIGALIAGLCLAAATAAAAVGDEARAMVEFAAPDAAARDVRFEPAVE